MKHISFFILFILYGAVSSQAQLSNKQVLDIQVQADDAKIQWIKAFEDGYKAKNLSRLPALRQSAETFINEQFYKLSITINQGDGREVLTAVRNYLQIQKQFVKNVMLPAESLQPGDEAAYQEINKEIANAAQKERYFLMDIRNALANSPEPIPVENEIENEEAVYGNGLQTDDTEEQDDEQLSIDDEEVKKENKRRRMKRMKKEERRNKLPHEIYDEKN